MLLNDIERRIQDPNTFRIQIPVGKKYPWTFWFWWFSNSKTPQKSQIENCWCVPCMCVYLNFGRGTHHIYIILHVAVFNSLLQFEIAMFDFPLQFFTWASICTSEFLRHTTISLIKLLKDIFLHSSIYFMFLATLSAFFGYVISLPLVLKSFQLISASYPWFWTCFHDFRIGFNPCPAYFSILPLVFSSCPNYFMILPLILIKFKPMPRILPLFSKQLHNLFQHVHWFAIVAPHISAAYRECSSIFPLPGLVFISFFLPSLSHQLSSLCLCFSLFMFIHFHFVHHLFSFWHCLYMVFIVIYCFINFNHL